MKQERLKEYEGYGYKTIGEFKDETIVAKRFKDGFVMIMGIHDKHTSQIRLMPEHVEKLLALARSAIEPTEPPKPTKIERSPT